MDFLPFNFALERILGGAASGRGPAARPSRSTETASASTSSPSLAAAAAAVETRLAAAEAEIEFLRAQFESISGPLEWARMKWQTETREQVRETEPNPRQAILDSVEQVERAYARAIPIFERLAREREIQEQGVAPTTPDSNEEPIAQRSARNVVLAARRHLENGRRLIAAPQMLELLRAQGVWPPPENTADDNPGALFEYVLQHRRLGEIHMYQFGDFRLRRFFLLPGEMIPVSHEIAEEFCDYGS